MIGNKLEPNNNRWRLIGININDAYMNMAIDEAIAKFISKKRVPNTIRFYRWRPSAVSIGYFQSITEEVNLDLCNKLKIDVVRRNTGGGAVYHDTDGELTYSTIIDLDNPFITQDIMKSYEIICSGLILGLKKFSITAEFRPINDIVVDGKKISGNAQTRRFDSFLQHGTILVDSNISKMFKVLKISNEKISDKMIKKAEERVTNLKKLLRSSVSFEEVFQALKMGFEETLGITLDEGKLTSEEQKLALKLKKEKYLKKSWNFKR
ncbi:MAG: lipoate--protein ligase family protein [Candidatus Bathyarchaeota archaeon]|nr:lipoate--protein ligase family protein [Candidatus Bathyarchaeota archaeon]